MSFVLLVIFLSWPSIDLSFVDVIALVNQLFHFENKLLLHKMILIVHLLQCLPGIHYRQIDHYQYDSVSLALVVSAHMLRMIFLAFNVSCAVVDVPLAIPEEAIDRVWSDDVAWCQQEQQGTNTHFTSLAFPLSSGLCVCEISWANALVLGKRQNRLGGFFLCKPEQLRERPQQLAAFVCAYGLWKPHFSI